VLTSPVHARILAALAAASKDRLQQIHYFYCLRLLHDGWTPAQKDELLSWYDATKTWQGGHSFTPFLENIFHDWSACITAEDAARLAAHGEQLPLATAALLRALPDAKLPPLAALGELYARTARANGDHFQNVLKATLVATLGKSTAPEAQGVMRKIADADPSQAEATARALARFPTAENAPYLVKGLGTGNVPLLVELVEALKKAPAPAKADDPAPFRAVLLASAKLDDKTRWKTVELLRHWTAGRRFGAEQGDSKTELAAWGQWFAQSFPKEPALPNLVAPTDAETQARYKELLAFLDQGAGKTGDAVRGRKVFEKAQCLKCHKYGKEGEGLGPDLTSLSKRFKRADTLESIIWPSKVISDQYRATFVTTTKGVPINGLASPLPDGGLSLILSDASKVVLKKEEIEQQAASLISVMPEKLLDGLDKTEIADLFAFLESEPAK
jgi:putative heme-binding domain-containing protein